LVNIRAEKTEDFERISEVNLEAFESETESRLIAAIRGSEYFIPELSLVAEIDGQIVGHILFSEISIHSSEKVYPVLSLAPMAVLPSFQNQGIGSALVRQGLEEVKKTEYDIIVLIGHPGYYPRFGFELARDHGLELEFEVPDEAFMVLETRPGALKNVSGVVKYPAAFNAAT
jgi:putative acetyltransferase